MSGTRIINAPDPDTMALLIRRMPMDIRKKLEGKIFDAVGLIQAALPDLFYFADIGQKAGAVLAVEILGNCPQHISTIAFLGDIESVNAAMKAIDENRRR